MAKKKKLDSLKELPQRDEVWAVINRSAPAWVEGPMDEPYRPRVVAVFEGSTGMVRGFFMTDYPGVSVNEVLEALRRAALAEMPGEAPGGAPLELPDDVELPERQEPYRPTRVVVEGEELAKALEHDLKGLGIDCQGTSYIPELDDFLRDMASHVSEEHVPGLAQVPGMSAFNVQEYFMAAADYYRAAPWKWLSNLHLIEFQFSADSQPRLACIMGNGREEFGLSIYDNLQQFEMMSNTQSSKGAERLARMQTISSVTFCPPWEGIPFDDLDDIERYNYPVADEDAYPLFLKVVPPGTRVAPTFEDLSRYSAAMRALPEFVARHMDADGKLPRPAQATLPLPDIYNGHTIAFRFPVTDEEIYLTPDMEQRGLADEDSLAAWLARELKARAPFEMRLNEDAAESLRGTLKIKRGQRLTCVDVHSPEELADGAEPGGPSGFFDDFGGLICAVQTGKQALLLPLTLVDAEDAQLPLQREIKAYQFLHYCRHADDQDDSLGLDGLEPELFDEILNRLASALPAEPPRKTGKRKRKRT